jgi:DNA repair exonuclease SbcCD ATPase subunit
MRKAIPVLATAAAFFLMPLVGAAQQASAPPPKPVHQQESLAEIARKAREQKKETPKPAKVYDNDSLENVSGTISVVGPAPQETTAASGEAAKGETQPPANAAGQKDQKYWRGKFAELRTKLHQTQEELDILQRELAQTRLQYYPDPMKAMQQQYSNKDINDKLAKIDAKQKELQGLQQQLSDLEDSLRKSGGDPGWARE